MRTAIVLLRLMLILAILILSIVSLPALFRNREDSSKLVYGADGSDTGNQTAIGLGINLDKVPPNSTLSYTHPCVKVNNTLYVKSSTMFILSTTDTSDVDATYYQIDNGNPIVCTRPFTLKGLSEGRHIITYYSKDKAGNSEPTKTIEVFLDDEPPKLSIYAPNNMSLIITRDVPISWSFEDEGSAIDHFELSMDDGQATVAWPSQRILIQRGHISIDNTTSFLFTGISDGEHRVVVKAFDQLGNEDEVMVTFAVRARNLPKTSTLTATSSATASTSINLIWLAVGCVAAVGVIAGGLFLKKIRLGLRKLLPRTLE